MAGDGGLGSAAPGCGQLLSQQPHPLPARVVLASPITLCLQPWGEGRDNGPLGPLLTSLLHPLFLMLNYLKHWRSPGR